MNSPDTSSKNIGKEIDNRPIVNCDQEAWILSRIRTTIDMAQALKERRNVQADDPLYTSAVKGLINGAAIEIINTLGMKPKYVNLYDPYK